MRRVNHTHQRTLSVVANLRSPLHVRLRTSLVQPATAVQLHDAKVRISWSPDHGPDVDLAVLSELTGFDTESFLQELSGPIPETLTTTVGRGEFAVVDLSAPRFCEELADVGPDFGLVGRALLGENFDQAELRASFATTHQRAVIVANMEIGHKWRGAAYGLLATELVLGELGRCADVAALFPMKPGLEDLAARDASARALADYWGRIGFAEFNGIMAMQLPVPAG